jgi:hypothetical protein
VEWRHGHEYARLLQHEHEATRRWRACRCFTETNAWRLNEVFANLEIKIKLIVVKVAKSIAPREAIKILPYWGLRMLFIIILRLIFSTMTCVLQIITKACFNWFN